MIRHYSVSVNCTTDSGIFQENIWKIVGSDVPQIWESATCTRKTQGESKGSPCCRQVIAVVYGHKRTQSIGKAGKSKQKQWSAIRRNDWFCRRDRPHCAETRKRRVSWRKCGMIWREKVMKKFIKSGCNWDAPVLYFNPERMDTEW